MALGVEIHMLAPLPESTEWLEQHGIHYVSCQQSELQCMAARRLLNYMIEVGFDGAINNDNSLLQSIAPALDCPIISIGHMATTSIAALACYNEPWVDYIVAISSDMQRAFTTRYGIPVERCPVIYNGVSDPLRNPLPDKPAGQPLRVVFAGGESRNKGADLIRAAVLRAPDAWCGVELHWFGNVSSGLRRRFASSRNVQFYGRVSREEFHEELARADVFLLPSRQEGCPMALLEAMSFGVVPVVSDGAGAMRWLVTNGENGFVCNLGDWAKLLPGCIKSLRDDWTFAAKMKVAARERYLEGLQSEQVAARILALLSRPTINRHMPARRIQVLKWHRPVAGASSRAPMIDRVCIRVGWLRVEGALDLEWLERSS